VEAIPSERKVARLSAKGVLLKSGEELAANAYEGLRFLHSRVAPRIWGKVRKGRLSQEAASHGKKTRSTKTVVCSLGKKHKLEKSKKTLRRETNNKFKPRGNLTKTHGSSHFGNMGDKNLPDRGRVFIKLQRKDGLNVNQLKKKGISGKDSANKKTNP